MADDGELPRVPQLTPDEIEGLRRILGEALEKANRPAAPVRPHIAPRLDRAPGIDTLVLAPWDAGAAVAALLRCGIPFSMRAGIIPAQGNPPQTVAEMTSWAWEAKGFVELRGPGDMLRSVLDAIAETAEDRLQEEFAFRLAQSADEQVAN